MSEHDNLQHVNVKLFVEGELSVDLVRFIEVFHGWISAQSMGEMLIDVADYRHVPNGPGVVLVGHEADYAIDHSGGRFGLLYNRKAPLAGSNQDRFLQAFTAAAGACGRLENELSGLAFSRREFQLFVNDRVLAPNTPETLSACQPQIETFLKDSLAAGDFRVEHDNDPRRRFGVTVELAEPFDLAKLVGV